MLTRPRAEGMWELEKTQREKLKVKEGKVRCSSSICNDGAVETQHVEAGER